jgi:Flp pilus assembly protein TadG
VFDISDYFRSVEAVWLIWLLALAGLALLTRALLKRISLGWIHGLFRDEDGAAYSLAYVMTVPIYIILICLVVETTSLLIVKIGTMYAAYAAARSRIVWDQIVPASADERMQLAGKQAMVPFASSNPLNRISSSAPGGNDTAYMAAYQKYANGVPPKQPSSAFWSNRYQYAWAATNVQLLRVDNQTDPTTGAVTPMYVVQVDHDAPLTVPLIGKILGDRKVGAYWVRRITSKIELSAELMQRIGDPQADNPASRPLGINYQPDLRN